ncbi:hypothetical protein WICMUC_001186 [Wickerhamomyces mucosus]|uniref:Pre-mRNA polyadenylation factor FIP1 n=1 Tax=Wickerhamomyces mucosus TaxID=1378264 RepID=A0A9P8THU5_9ASCO|nr:hypothetical protein WICMUC_001186 [Wickerhamomyces mucosus]
MSLDDDDAFLYGDDDSESHVQLNNLDQKKDSDNANNIARTPEPIKEDEEDNNNGQGQEEDEEDEDSDESDSDIEFIIGNEETKDSTGAKQETNSTNTTIATATQPESATISAAGTANELNSELAPQEDGTVENTTDSKSTITRVPGIEIEKVGTYNEVPITSINLQDLKEKPWRQPGADISEYFNYGFNEFTWMQYCTKQDTLRANYNQQKLMMRFMPIPGMPPIPGMLPSTANTASMPSIPNIPIPQMPQIPQQPQLQQHQQPQPPQQPQAQLSVSQDAELSFPKAPRDQRDYQDQKFEQKGYGNTGGYQNNYRDRDRSQRYGNRRR